MNKRSNKVIFLNKTHTAPDGYVFLNIGDKIKKGDSVFSIMEDNTPYVIDKLKYVSFVYENSNIQDAYMQPSIRKIRAPKPLIVSPVPKKYTIELNKEEIKDLKQIIDFLNIDKNGLSSISEKIRLILG